jgi:mRNA-degrading endonuclease RelE of RelBE toxin-antitoxin system
MEIRLYEMAEKDLDATDNTTYSLFNKHIDKISRLPPRRHLKFGMPFNVEEIGQGRIVYNIKDETLFIIRCFSTHKEYEKWYKSFK